jgi:exodeoxyribonuclease VII small subunit
MTDAGEQRHDEAVLGSLTFEELVEELESTIARMAGGNLGIEEVTGLYERAGRLHALAGERLSAIAARIDKLTASDG